MKFLRNIAVSVAAGALLTSTIFVSPALASDESLQVQDFPALTMMMDPSGSETTSTFTVEPGEYTTQDGQRLSYATRATYQCQGKTDNPHYSAGTGGVIAKTRVTCSGPSGLIPISVYSMLGRTTQNSISSLSIVATSHYTQNVSVNGSSQTWYVPSQGSGQQIPRGAYFRGSHSGQGAAPLSPFNIGAAASAFVYVP